MPPLSDLISAFNKVAGPDYAYPLGSSADTVLEEQALIDAIESYEQPTAAKLAVLSTGLEKQRNYDLVIFGTRILLRATNRHSLTSYRAGLLPVIACIERIDYRDALGVYAIANDCAKRLGSDLFAEVNTVISEPEFASRASDLYDYYSKHRPLPTLHQVGYRAVGDPPNLTYVREI